MFEKLNASGKTPTEIAIIVGVHVGTVYRWMFNGVRGKRLQSILVGGRRRILDQHLSEFLQLGNQVAAKVDDRRSQQAQDTLASFGVRSQKDRSCK